MLRFRHTSIAALTLLTLSALLAWAIGCSTNITVVNADKGNTSTEGEPAATGACCNDLDCSITTEADCQASYAGDGTSCDPSPCTEEGKGACCLSQACATNFSEEECIGLDGDFLGAGTVCEPEPCTGACCIDGTCMPDDRKAFCEDTGGEFQGFGTDCEPDPCSTVTGACCVEGTCSETIEAECSGDYQGDDSTCDPNPCEVSERSGACCLSQSCFADTTPTFCEDSGGIYQGDGTGCDPDPCPGACCYDDECAADQSRGFCETAGGVFQGNGSTCDPDPCAAPTGACCYQNGEDGPRGCVEVTEDECNGMPAPAIIEGFQAGTSCTPNPCE